MPRKLTLEYIKVKTKEIAEGYECLSKVYLGNREKLLFRCDKGHIHKTSWSSFFNASSRCTICSGKKKKTIEEIKNYVESFDYKCLSEEYINNKTKLELECDKGHIYNASWDSFFHKQRCPICWEKDSGRKTLLEVEEFINEFGCKCLSKEYINSYTKLEFKCDREHIFYITLKSFRLHRRCPICAIENKSGANHYSWKNYSEESRKDFRLYREEIIQLSNYNYRKYFYVINPNNLKRGRSKYHLDHIYSVIDGFNNNVSPKVIANPINLQMLSENANAVKNSTSHITLEQLYDLYEQFIMKEKGYCYNA